MAQKPKLAYILHEIALGGAEVAFLSALPHLAKEFDLRVFVLHRGNQKLIDAIPAHLREKMMFCNVPLPLYPFYIIGLAIRILKFTPRYLVCSLWRSCVIGSLVKWFNSKICYYPFIHNSTFFHLPDRWASLQAMRKADAIFVDSRSASDFVKNSCRINDKPVSIISFVTEPTPHAVPGYDFQQKRFVFIGRMNPVKNLSVAIRSIAWLREHGVDAYLTIYGRDDGDLVHIKQAIKQEGMGLYVELKGELLPADKLSVLWGNDYPYYLQLSKVEGMAMSVVEAMQAGKVCVLTAVGEIPHYARDGSSALFMDCSSPDAWEQSIERMVEIISDPSKCRRLSEAAHGVFRDKPLFKDSLANAIRMNGGRHA